MSSRLEILQGMVAQDPANTFARYGLAIEFSNHGNYAEAVRQFEELIATNPDYCAAYYHGGQAWEKAGNPEEAAAIYRRGVDATRRTGDMHTRMELESALALLR